MNMIIKSKKKEKCKGLFFSLPSISIDKTLTPIIDGIASTSYEIIYYNIERFRPSCKYKFTFRPYPDAYQGFDTEALNENTSYFGLGEMLVDTSFSLFDFLVQEVEKEQPDFIIHSHLAVWGKLLAKRFQLPGITLFTTHVLDAKIMLPFFRELNINKGSPKQSALIYGNC